MFDDSMRGNSEPWVSQMWHWPCCAKAMQIAELSRLLGICAQAPPHRSHAAAKLKQRLV